MVSLSTNPLTGTNLGAMKTRDFESLLRQIGQGRMSNTAYDTAWLALLDEFDAGMSSRAIGWISEHQLPDGSWGALEPLYYHDRIICTLAAMIALTKRGHRSSDRTMISRGLEALERITSGATRGLSGDPNGATAGFEMIVPTLVAEAERLGIIRQQGDRILGRLARQRTEKLAKLDGRRITRHITPAFSAEMAGHDGKHALDADNLQESNGSVANSPSATAYFVLHLKHDDPEAMSYLRKWSAGEGGGAPDFAPIDVFELSWSLWNLRLLTNLDQNLLQLCKPHLDTLEAAWAAGVGVGTASQGTIKDCDDTSLVFDVLSSYGRQPDIGAVLSFEEENYFRCFPLETNPSISANIHVLGALRRASFDRNHPSVQKVITFLRQNRVRDEYWFDKWHASPYYATAHAIILARGYDNEMCGKAIEWILKSQKANGSWGFYENSTAEETAYCIQALSIWQRHAGDVPPGRIALAGSWLSRNSEAAYPSLWIGKALYCPELVVRSTILSALELAKGA